MKPKKRLSNNDHFPRAYSTKFIDNMLKSNITLFVPQEDFYLLQNRYERLMKRYLKLKGVK